MTSSPPIIAQKPAPRKPSARIRVDEIRDTHTLDALAGARPLPDVPCPLCQAAQVRYSVAYHAVGCAACDWQCILNPRHAAELSFALGGITAMDVPAFLRAVAASSSPIAPQPQLLAYASLNADGLKTVVPPQSTETPWDRLQRLSEQAAANTVAVECRTDLAAWQPGHPIRFAVSSQRRPLDGGPVCDHEVTVWPPHGIACGCQANRGRPLTTPAPCAHIAAVYDWLLLAQVAEPPAPAPVDVQARYAAAMDDLYGPGAARMAS